MSFLWEMLESYPWLRIPLLSAALYGAYRFMSKILSRPPIDVTDKTVLITGASSGVGRSLAFRFHKAGAKLILVARSLDKLEQLAAELKVAHPENGNEPSYRYLDVAEPNGVAELSSLSPNGKIDILINNAGQSMRGSCQDTTMKVQRQIMDVNYFGQIEITRGLIDYIPDDGCVVLISSVQGKIAVPYRSAYSASKHAVEAYFDCLRGEQSRVNVLSVCPSYINTNIGKSALLASGEKSGKDESELLSGMSADYVAERVFQATIERRYELVLGPIHHRLAVFIRHLFPSLFFFIMRRRALKEQTEEH